MIEVKCSQNTSTSRVHHYPHSYRVTAISDQWYFSYFTDKIIAWTHLHTDGQH